MRLRGLLRCGSFTAVEIQASEVSLEAVAGMRGAHAYDCTSVSLHKLPKHPHACILIHCVPLLRAVFVSTSRR